MYFGEGSINKLKEIIEKERCENIFLIRSKKSYKNFKKKIENLIKCNFVSYCDFETSLSIDDVKRGLNLFQKRNFDLIIAVGGGSVIDMAKLIGIFSANSGQIYDYLSNELVFKKKSCRVVAVPTTAGSGSEVTHFAVLYDGSTKYSISHQDFILPRYAVVDPLLTHTMPTYLTAVCGMDALCQAIESYWSVTSSEESKNLSIEAIRLIFSNLEKSVSSPSNESRSNMSKASHLAGKAINLTKTTAPHAVSYPLTKIFNIPHGHAVALTIGRFYEFNYDVHSDNLNDKRGDKFIVDEIDKLNKVMGVSCVMDANKKIKYLMKNIGLETSLYKLGIKSEEDVNIIVKNINPERIDNNPKKVNKKDVKNILMSMIRNPC